MTDFFQRTEYVIREHVGFTSLHEAYDIYDAEGKTLLATATEQTSLWVMIQKLFLDKAFLPALVQVHDAAGRLLLELEQPRSLIVATLNARDAEGKLLGTFKQNLLSYGGALEVTGPDGLPLGTISGDWKCRQYLFCDTAGRTLATIDHLYGGVARELLTTADDYRVKIVGDQKIAPLVLAGALAIDLVFHEA
ncbi:MAG: hypothetical protein OZSIB_1214 [Candidatus Ozemobacter sibiricus]|jgi:uncharacterized protein YxjI|uniref:Scramblase n=1 Tax=Candidatus Ozemobacter sibiricus TaxID=2268124 RepID=A0A367ZLG3_9BACT|nr:MAG: hypothetical protein OZSIB_1214 [Candidatus Ozemobacter sibiricus]